MYSVGHNKHATIISTINLMFLGRFFCNFYTIWNMNEYGINELQNVNFALTVSDAT